MLCRRPGTSERRQRAIPLPRVLRRSGPHLVFSGQVWRPQSVQVTRTRESTKMAARPSEMAPNARIAANAKWHARRFMRSARITASPSSPDADLAMCDASENTTAGSPNGKNTRHAISARAAHTMQMRPLQSCTSTSPHCTCRLCVLCVYAPVVTRSNASKTALYQLIQLQLYAFTNH